jgi:hypothetical protein
VIFFGCGAAALCSLYYCSANSLNFAKQILFGQRFSEIPPNPPLEKGGEGGISGRRVVLGKAWSFGCGFAALCSSVSKINFLVAALPRCVHPCPKIVFYFLTYLPLFPPDFFNSMISEMIIPRSTALHMS